MFQAVKKNVFPSGVRLPHNVILNRLSWQWRTFPFEENEAICVFKTAITFVDAVSEIWAPLLHSEPRTLLILPKHLTRDAEKLLTVLNKFEVRRLILVPSLLQAILMYVDMTLKQLVSKNDSLYLSTVSLFLTYAPSLFPILSFFHPE